jgi:hypothetical protein
MARVQRLMLVALAMVGCRERPRLLPDAPWAPERLASSLDAPAILARPINGHAIRENERPTAPAVCDYPDNREETGLTYYHPCWCGDGQRHGSQGIYLSTCTAESYLEDVQTFGPPRGVHVPIARPEYTVTVDAESE